MPDTQTIQFATPKKYTAEVVNNFHLTHEVAQLDLKIVEPEGFFFTSGQFINLQVSPTAYRSYSIVSDYKTPLNISLIVSVGHEGLGANFVKNLKIGDKVGLIGPSGRFVVPPILLEDLYFISTGTGLAPHLAMLYKIVDMNTTSRIKFLMGFRHESDIFMINQLKSFKEKLGNLQYISAISQPETSFVEMDMVDGRVTDHINIEKTTKTQVFLCGNPTMVEDTFILLEKIGVPRENIFSEKFTVMKV